ncbi:MAG: RHS repeat protein [Planctomycetota bacterium]|nr:RHS repeat protein [Planctomycetota bacterium]
MPRPPKPDLDLVNVGAIIDQPFFYQAGRSASARVPSALNTVTKAAAIPGGTSEGQTTYSYGPLQELTGEVQANGGATKATRYVYVAPDPVLVLAELESRAADQEKAHAALDLDESASKAARASALQRLQLTRQKIARVRDEGASLPARLASSSWIETGEGSLIVKGATRFEYNCTDVVSATTTITTMQTPPRVHEMGSTFRYNDLGQVSEIDAAGSVTRCEYDALGRLAVKRGKFASPSGDFLAHHRTVFLYSPPAGSADPAAPPDALLSSTNDSISGTSSAFQQTPEPLNSVPTPPGSPPVGEDADKDKAPSWLERLLGSTPDTAPQPSSPPRDASIDPPGAEGDFDHTNVMGTYAYP